MHQKCRLGLDCCSTPGAGVWWGIFCVAALIEAEPQSPEMHSLKSKVVDTFAEVRENDVVNLAAEPLSLNQNPKLA